MGRTQDQLIEKLKSGDASAGEYVYKIYAPELLGVCMRYIRNKSDAEDVLQESFIDIFQKIGQLKSNNAFKSWMARIVVNNSLNFLKRQHPDYDIDEMSESLSEEDDADAPKDVKERILDCEISQEDMLEVVNSLPSGFRTVFNLYVFEKMKHNEIAKELNISVSTSKSQLLRARKLIQRRLYDKMIDKEEDKKERAIFALFPVFMKDNLEYIDKLALEKLEGISIMPEKGVPEMPSSGSGAASSASIAKSKVASFIGSKVAWVSSIVVGAAVVGAIVVTNNNDKNNIPVVVSDTTVIEEVNEISVPKEQKDSVSNVEVFHEMTEPNDVEVVKVEREPIEPQVKKVFVKKVIKVKQQKVITDTIFKTDTLHLY